MAGTFDQMPDADTTYGITEYDSGGTWKFQTTEPTTLEKATLNWQKIGTGKWMIQVPAGTADRAAPIREDQRANEPNKRKGYGRMQNNDYIHVDLLNEIYRVRNRLRKTQRGHAWENTFDEENYNAG